MKKLWILLLLALLTPAAAQEGEEKPPDPKARFWEARQVMLKGDPKSAAELFRVLVKDHPKADIADDSLYWMGRCNLRVADREPEAVVAFIRLIRKYPASPFVDDAARELMRLGDRTVVPELRQRLAEGGANAELTAKALAEFDDEAGVDYLKEKDGAVARVVEPKTEGDELQALRDEIRRLRKQVEDSLKLLEKLLAEKARKESAGRDESEK